MTMDLGAFTTGGFTNFSFFLFLLGMCLLDEYFLQQHRYIHNEMAIMMRIVLLIVYNLFG